MRENVPGLVTKHRIEELQTHDLGSSSPEMELSTRRRAHVTESCPVCKEAPDLRLALTCVSCRARYHLGCIAESRSRRCVACHSRVVPPAKLHIERLRRKLSWRPTRIWLMVGTSLTLMAMGVHIRVYGSFIASYLLIYLALILKGKWDRKHQEQPCPHL